MIRPYLRLYRVDVALISFFAVIAGSYFSGTTGPSDVYVALLVSAVSMNFVYSFNAWADWRIDAINKAHRPIPSGQITPRAALTYSLVLLAGALVYPPFVASTPASLALLYLLPALGLAYSGPPRLKLYSVAAIATTSLIQLVPLLIGYFRRTQSTAYVPLFGLVFLFCLSVIPLKDIEDERGDTAFGSQNVSVRLGKKALLRLSAAGLTLALALQPFLSLPSELRPYIAVFFAIALIAVLCFARFGLDVRKLYRTIIWLVVVQGVLFGIGWPLIVGGGFTDAR